MISTLIIVFLIFILLLVFRLFKVGFVRGKIYDVTTGNPKKGTKSAEFLHEVFKGINFINSKPYDWHYIKSVDGLTLVARYFENKKSNQKREKEIQHNKRVQNSNNYKMHNVFCAIKSKKKII